MTPGNATLDDLEWQGLESLLVTVLPSESGPGAAEARALDYVRSRIHLAPELIVEALRPHLRRAVTDPDAVLSELSAAPGSSDWFLFRQVRSWAWEGYLCEPALGGNRDEVGWRRLGIPHAPQPIGYRPEELLFRTEDAKRATTLTSTSDGPTEPTEPTEPGA